MNSNCRFIGIAYLFIVLANSISWAQVTKRVEVLTPFSVKSSESDTEEKIGFKNANGQIVVNAIYDEIYDLSEGLVGIRIGGKIGFMDQTGKVVIPLKYSDVHEFSGGLASVNIGACCHAPMTGVFGGKWGYIDKTGRMVIAIKYDFAGNFKNGVASVKKLAPGDNPNQGKYALINKAGGELTAFKYDGLHSSSEGLMLANINGKFGFLDNTGKEFIALKFDNAFPFANGLAAVKLNDKWGFIDKTGKVIISLQYEDEAYVYGFGQGVSRMKLNSKFGVIDKTGREIVPPKYEMIETFEHNMAATKFKGKWGYINTIGEVIIDFKYDKASTFYDSTTKVLRDGNEYSIDFNGKETLTKGVEKVIVVPVAKATPPSPEDYRDAVEQGDDKKVASMIGQGLDINLHYSGGWGYGLHDAILLNKHALAEYLINQGFNVKIIGQDKKTALHFACWNNTNYGYGTNNLGLATLIIKNGGDVNASDILGTTPLHLAAEGGDVELVRLLLKSGASTKLKMYSKDTALDLARKNKHTEIVDLIKNFKEQG